MMPGVLGMQWERYIAERKKATTALWPILHDYTMKAVNCVVELKNEYRLQRHFKMDGTINSFNKLDADDDILYEEWCGYVELLNLFIINFVLSGEKEESFGKPIPGESGE